MTNLTNSIQIKGTVDGTDLAKLGYRLNIKKGGYVSRSGATIIYLYRKPYHGEVVPTNDIAYTEEKHQTDIAVLKENHMLTVTV